MKKGVTIYKIAEEAGVSPATVSRVLTGNSKVSPEKLERVNELIEKYNFTPNALAKGLSESHSKTIGMICADISNPYYSSLFIACEKESYKQGYNLSLYSTFSQSEFELRNLIKLYEQRAEAIIVVGGQIDRLHPDPAVKQEIEKLSKAIPVIITAEIDYGKAVAVRINQERAMEEAVGYLLSLGHKHIVNIPGHPGVLSTVVKNRIFIEKMKAGGGVLNDRSIVSDLFSDHYTFESGIEAMNRILSYENRPTAVICTNDMCAAGVLRVLQERGIRVPNEISIVSFDDTYLSDMLTPRVTSVGYNYDTFAQNLVETAINLIENKPFERKSEMLPHIEVKESCKPLCETVSINEK